jgi:hypothetical protein
MCAECGIVAAQGVLSENCRLPTKFDSFCPLLFSSNTEKSLA